MTRSIRALIKGDGPTRFVGVQEGYVGPGSTIHNWFPDGAITSDDFIESGPNQLFFASFGDETLTFSDPGIHVTLPDAGWDRGLQVESPTLPSGRYELGFNFSGTGTDFLRFRVNPTATYDYAEQFIIPGVSQGRYVLRFNLKTDGNVQFIIDRNSVFNAWADTPSVGEFTLTRIMLTEGDGLIFADGDSDDWSWSGTPNASASRGPQP